MVNPVSRLLPGVSKAGREIGLPTGRPATALHRIRKRIAIAVLALLVMIAVGTGGFMYIAEGHATLSDALYMTLITITTVGYSEVVRPDGMAERLFTGLMAIFGFGTLTFLFTSMTVFFLEADLDYTLRRKRMEKDIRKLRSHFIICGFGRVGRNVAQELDATHRRYVAIDPDLEMLESHKERQPKLLYLHGDASDDDLLLAADIADAAGVFAVTGDDSRNLMIVLTARQLNPRVRVVARCHELRNIEKMRKAGADTVVSPDFTGGMRIASAMIRPRVVSFLDEMLRHEHNLRLEELPVPEYFAARALGTMKLRGPHYILLSVKTANDWVFNPPDEFIVHPGHTLVCMTTPHGREELEAVMRNALA